MTDFVKLFGAVCILGAMRALQVTWFLLKATVLMAVLFGAAKEVFASAGGSWPPWELSISVVFAYASLAFNTLAENWLGTSLALLFWAVWALLLPLANEIQSHTYQTKVAAVAIGNYLKIGIDTDLTTEILNKGFFRSLANRARWQPLIWFLGGENVDDSLSAKAVRWGSEVSLSDDLKSELKGLKSELKGVLDRIENTLARST